MQLLKQCSAGLTRGKLRKQETQQGPEQGSTAWSGPEFKRCLAIWPGVKAQKLKSLCKKACPGLWPTSGGRA